MPRKSKRASAARIKQLVKTADVERFHVHLFNADTRQETVNKCRFGTVSPLISGSTFPVTIQHSGSRWMSLVSFEEVVTSAEVMRMFLARKEFSGGADALLALFGEHGNNCFLRTMVALGQTWTPLGEPSVVLSASYGLDGKKLLTIPEEQSWPENTSFLGVDVRPRLAYHLW